MKKAEQLEVELDKTKEELVIKMILQLGWIIMMDRLGSSAGDLFGIRMVCGVMIATCWSHFKSLTVYSGCHNSAIGRQGKGFARGRVGSGKSEQVYTQLRERTTLTGGIFNKKVDNVEKVPNQESPTPRGRTRDL